MPHLCGELLRPWRTGPGEPGSTQTANFHLHSSSHGPKARVLSSPVRNRLRHIHPLQPTQRRRIKNTFADRFLGRKNNIPEYENSLRREFSVLHNSPVINLIRWLHGLLF